MPNTGASEASGGPFWITLTDTLICAWKLKSYRKKQLLLKGLWHNSILIIASPHTYRHTHIYKHIYRHTDIQTSAPSAFHTQDALALPVLMSNQVFFLRFWVFFSLQDALKIHTYFYILFMFQNAPKMLPKRSPKAPKIDPKSIKK